MMNECDDFAAACIDASRLERIIERNREVFTRRRVRPDCILAPPGTKLFISMVSHGARAMFQTFGPNGDEMFVEGPPAAGILRGDLVLFEGREYDVGNGGPAIMPLERPVTIGEAYVMGIGYRRSQPMYGENAYRTGQRDKYIFDATANDYKKVSFAKAFLYSGAYMNSDGDYAPDPRFGQMADNLTADLQTNSEVQAEMREYAENQELHDAIMGDEPSRRALPLMIAHDTAAGEFFVPRVLGQFDLDVINTADFVQMAQSVYEKMLKDETTRANYTKLLERCQSTTDAAVAEQNARALAAFNAAYNPTGGRDSRQVAAKRLGLAKKQGAEAIEFVPYSSNSPASLIQLKSPAAFLFGALPLGVATESLVYSPVNTATGKLEKAPTDNRIAQWLATVQKSAAASGKEDAQYKAATASRMSVIAKVSGLFQKMTPSNAMTIREAVQKVFSSNVAADGSYKEGKSSVTLEKDLTDAAGKAETFAAHSNSAASEILSVHKSDYSVNPFATVSSNAPAVLNADQVSAVKAAFGDFTTAINSMEERIMLHGSASEFDAENPSAWVDAVEKSGKASQQSLRVTKAAAEAFERTHRELSNAIAQNILSAAPAAEERGKSGFLNSAAMDRFGNFAATEAAAQVAEAGDFFATGDFYSGKQRTAGAVVLGGGKGANAGRLERGAMGYRVAQGAANSVTVPEELKVIYNSLLNIPNRRDCLMMLINADIHVPFNLILWRLWIRHRMYTMVMMKSGLEMGGTIVGQVNYAMAAEVTTKTLEGHVTFNYASICWNDRLVLHIPNAIPRGYMGGWNNLFIESRDEINNVAEASRGSLLVTLIPITENTFQFPLNFVPKQRMINAANGISQEYKDKVRLYGTYSSAAFYEQLWGLKDAVAFSEAYDTYSTQYKMDNTIAYEGKSFDYSPADRFFSVYHEGTGHLSGNRTGRGCMQTWEGNATMFPDQTKLAYRLP